MVQHAFVSLLAGAEKIWRRDRSVGRENLGESANSRRVSKKYGVPCAQQGKVADRVGFDSSAEFEVVCLGAGGSWTLSMRRVHVCSAIGGPVAV